MPSRFELLLVGFILLLELLGLAVATGLETTFGFATGLVGFGVCVAGISGLVGLGLTAGVVTGVGVVETVLLACRANNFPPLSNKNKTAAITVAINNAINKSTQLRLRNSIKRSKTGESLS